MLHSSVERKIMKWKAILKNLDVIAIIAASIGAIVLHHLGIIPETYVISILLLLLALHTLQDALRGEEVKEDIKTISKNVQVSDPEVELIKPRELLVYTEEFALKNRGEVWWFNACCSMFRSQELFDRLLKTSIDSSRTTKIYFVMNKTMKEAWERDIMPKIEKCRGRDKVQEPVWRAIDESIAFQMIDVGWTGKPRGPPGILGRTLYDGAGQRGTACAQVPYPCQKPVRAHLRLQDIFVRCRLKNS
jgi:hypothetical protein